MTTQIDPTTTVTPGRLAGLHSEVPNASRIYDYFLGGEDNFPADRHAADSIVQLLPGGPYGARANRRFHGRAVRHAAGLGIRQFLDLGSGIPVVESTHEVARRVAPDARVLYVDTDPVVAAHAGTLLDPADRQTAFLQGDFQDPDAVLGSAQAAQILDLSQPVALMVVALLHFFPESKHPYELLNRYKDALAPGSAIIMTHSSFDYVPADVVEAISNLYVTLQVDLASRPRAEIERFVTSPGWAPIEPGVVSANEWHTAEEDVTQADRDTSREDAAGYAVFALKTA